MIEQHNTITLNSPSELRTSLERLYYRVMDRPDRNGLPRIFYKDAFDTFAMRIEKSNVGYSLSCALNNQQAYQLNNSRFSGETQIGEVMLIAAGAKGQEIDKFFTC